MSVTLVVNVVLHNLGEGLSLIATNQVESRILGHCSSSLLSSFVYLIFPLWMTNQNCISSHVVVIYLKHPEKNGKKKSSRADLTSASEENVTLPVTVSQQWCALVAETLFPLAFFPKDATQHLPPRIKARAPRHRKTPICCSAHAAILSSYTACGQPRQTTTLRLQAPPDKLDPGRGAKHLAAVNNWTFGDLCCRFAAWD